MMRGPAGCSRGGASPGRGRGGPRCRPPVRAAADGNSNGHSNRNGNSKRNSNSNN